MIDEKRDTRVVRIFFGTRADLAASPMTYVWQCESCQSPTYSEASPPPNHKLVCNVCVSQIAAKAEKEPKNHVGWNITDQGWDIFSDMAEAKQRPVEDVFHDVMEWQVRRPITGEIYRKSEKKAEK